MIESIMQLSKYLELHLNLFPNFLLHANVMAFVAAKESTLMANSSVVINADQLKWPIMNTA